MIHGSTRKVNKPKRHASKATNTAQRLRHMAPRSSALSRSCTLVDVEGLLAPCLPMDYGMRQKLEHDKKQPNRPVPYDHFLLKRRIIAV